MNGCESKENVGVISNMLNINKPKYQVISLQNIYYGISPAK